MSTWTNRAWEREEDGSKKINQDTEEVYAFLVCETECLPWRKLFVIRKSYTLQRTDVKQFFKNMQTLRKKTSPCKYRNDPGRFFGDGVQFKAKLIGILEVGEARGDRMCQEALQDLKMAIRAAGEHKQRITIHVTIDGLRLRDEKTGDSLYHHPVHKISFIAQDMTDSRAFGYIFGSPDSGHRFFGIKTDKAASQVVLAMRDLFQVVFELKKKEIELARQQIQSKTLHHHDQHQLASLSSLKSAAASGANDLSGLGGGSATSAATLSMLNNMVSSSTNTPNASRLGVNLDSKGASKEISPESVADLVDLEQELSSLQRGITQMERITPNDGHSQHSSLPITNSKLSTSVGNGGGGGAADPFGDSFTSFPTLPPPEPGRLRSKTTPKSNDITSTSSTNAQNASLLSPSATQSRLSPVSSTTTAPATAASSSIATIQPLDVDDDDNWLRELDAHSDVFDTSKTVVPGLMGMPPLASSLSSGVTLTSRAPLAPRESSDTPPNHIYETVSCSTTNVMADMSELSHASNTDNTNNLANSSSLSDIFQSAAEAVQNSKLDIKSDAFTDLDPLGIGRTRPYVDKKYFFQELKNPPKKVLKDLTATTNTSTSGTATATAATTITSMADNQSNTTITLTDDILNLNYIELKSQPQFQQQPQQHHHHHHPPPLHHNQQQQQHQLQQQQITSTNINSLLTTTSYSPATTELATLTTATVYSHASPLTTTINNSTALANLNVSSNTDTASTSLICTCPTSIIVTCTTTNASTNRFTNNSGNNNSNISNNNSNLLTHQTNNNNNNNNNNNSNNIIMNVGSVVGGEGGQSHILAAIKSAASTTTKLTSSSSSTQPQASSINQTNTLRFSRYPPLEPVMAPIANDPVLLPRDTDPFSPTRKKSDPFEEGGDIFSKLDPFEFEFNSSTERPIGEDKIRKPNLSSPSIDVDAATVSAAHTPQDILSGPLQVSLPPEGGDVVQTISTVRSRPVPSTMGSMNAAQTGGALPPASMLRQQTADVISSISNKKMPHLFGQSSRFSKRDSNNINMRRLQESDSLSETETAPEPPPRPDSASYAEPPPLPPKKQFNDIIIRPRANSSSLSMNSANRYDSLNSALTTKIGSSTTRPSSAMSADVPPIPLPSRRVGRTDGSYPGPGRPRKPGHTEDDYLAPLSIIHSSSTTSSGSAVNATMPDVPPLLPPPTQTSSRSRTQRQHSLNRPHDIYENKNEILQQQLQQQLQQKQQQQQQQQQRTSETPPIVPDITLSQLLTLGIDDLALKLNVPISKLSTMTLVELTSYLSEFLEQSKPRTDNKMEILSSSVSRDEPPQHTPPIFKVNFDQEATFVAKFDDTFGEDFHQTSSSSATEFEANFAQFDCVNVEPPVQAINQNSVPPADRYAVFREIIDQELQQQQEEVDLIGDVMEAEDIMQNDEQRFETTNNIVDFDMNNLTHQQPDLLSGDMLEVTSGPQPTTIDTKISEVLAQAKDRYAALRDLILVENLFDKPPPQVPARNGIELVESLHSETKSPFQGFSGFNDDEDDQDLRQLMDQASTLDSTTQQQRLGLVDSRGFLVEPSSSAITVEEDEDEEEEEEDEDRRHRRNTREDNGGLSSGDSNGDKERDKGHMPISKYEQLASSNQQLEELEDKREVKYEEPPKISISQIQSNNDSKYLSVASVASSGLSGSKDDLEIDDLMHRAISNLSLDSKERNSPAMQAQQNTTTTMTPPHFNDVSTSPMPLQRSPVVGGSSIISQNKSPNNRSPQQISPLPPTLTAVSQLIDVVTKQIEGDVVSKTSNDSWATFDTPQHQPSVPAVSSDKRARPSAKNLTKATNFLNLPPPPGSTSNCSQNDSAIESPCSSDPRDEAWHKHTMGGSSLSLGHHTTAVGSSSAQRRYHKKERQNTSSSSRDLSWDEDQVGGSGGGVSGVGPPHIMDYPQSKRLSGQSQGSLTTDRHGYYRRHARRMNSCDEDYDYEQDYVASRREQPCKYKHSLSRSRDNFDMESPGWYHHHGGGVQHPHHTWSSQDIEQSRGRTFDRAAYERTTYGPPIYDKRGVGPPLAPTTSYDRRSGGGVYDKRSKYYRGDSNPRSSNADRIYNLDDFDQMLAASGKIPPHLASMYEEMKADCCSPPMALHQRQRAADFMYERERKSFDRESLESYEGSNIAPRRRRRSYDSGGVPSDPYGSCDSREDYHRERCVMTADKSRSLRKSLKSLRVSGDIDYDQDSEKDYHYRDQRSRCDTRSLQRPSQLSTQGISVVGGTSANVLGSQSRIRKSSGSSPWDGEEPTLPGQKTSSSSWKRPSSAAEAERRLAENRRAAVKGQTPSGSDEDKDRRYRKKRGSRNKDLPAINSGGRYRNSNYDYISCEDLDDDAEDYVDEEEEEDRGIEDDEISPPDEDKFARLEMRRHEMHNRMMDAHVRRRKDVAPSQTSQTSSMAYRRGGKATTYARRPLPPPTEPKHPQDYGYDDDDGEYEQTPTPRSNTSSALPTATPNTNTKFSFDIGFESDFNQSSPPPAPAGTASSCTSTPAANVSAANTPASKSSFRFSNDFSAGQEREKQQQQHPPTTGSLQQYDLENRGISPQTATTQTSTPKLRFDDNVKVSQFDDAFEDDFSKATFEAFQNDDDQWQETTVAVQKTSKQQIRNNKLQQRQQDLIRKSESVNIFAKKVEDPFEDDEFFNSPPTTQIQNSASNDKPENHKTTSNGGGNNGNNTAGNHGNNNGNNFQSQNWDDDNTNFAKFDENM